MKITDAIAEIILDIADEQNLPPERVARIVRSYWRAIGVIIRFAQFPICIKLDYFGKIVYNELQALMTEKRFREKGSKRKVHKINRRPITIDEINGTRSGNSITGSNG